MNQIVLQIARKEIERAAFWLGPLDGEWSDVVDRRAHLKLAEEDLEAALEHVRKMKEPLCR